MDETVPALPKGTRANTVAVGPFARAAAGHAMQVRDAGRTRAPMRLWRAITTRDRGYRNTATVGGWGYDRCVLRPALDNRTSAGRPATQRVPARPAARRPPDRLDDRPLDVVGPSAFNRPSAIRIGGVGDAGDPFNSAPADDQDGRIDLRRRSESATRQRPARAQRPMAQPAVGSRHARLHTAAHDGLPQDQVRGD